MNIETTVQGLSQKRDELMLQAHLFKAEARDEWHKLEKRWQRFTSEIDRLADATDDTDDNVNAFVRALAIEVEEGYHGLRESLKDPLP
jgi:SMC interacting uncharacterized protein involved in chromosome segregation